MGFRRVPVSSRGKSKAYFFLYCVCMPNDNSTSLRKRFLNTIRKNWFQNDHDLQEINCVYAFISIGFWSRELDIVYVGSTTKLFSRYKTHKIPNKINGNGDYSLMYFMPMNKGFYDYEIKLIKKLQPLYNKQHKKCH